MHNLRLSILSSINFSSISIYRQADIGANNQKNRSSKNNKFLDDLQYFIFSKSLHQTILQKKHRLIHRHQNRNLVDH